jgi:putative acetyltransferase
MKEIGRLHDAAFGDPLVAPLVDALRASAEHVAELSLVAEHARPDGPLVVGHVLLSPARMEFDPEGHTRGTTPILILSPLGVLPGFQGRGIGAGLTRAALAIADARIEPLVIVQGHPDYYPRFGFVRGRTIGVLPPEHLGAIDAAWMVRVRPGVRRPPRGRVVYPAPFLALDG